MRTPSAPERNASRTNVGLMRPEYIKRTIRMFGAYFTREIPARSAAAYVHQLQKNAMIRGSHAFDSAARTSGSASATQITPAISARTNAFRKCFWSIAPDGHAAAHTPHPLHLTSRTCTTPFSRSYVSASYGQRPTHT